LFLGNFFNGVVMNLETVFHITAFILVFTCLAISITFRRRAAQSGEKISQREEGALILTLRSLFGLALWGSVLLYLLNPAWLAWSHLELPAGVRWGGAALMAACLPFIYWLFRSLGLNVTHTVAIRKAHTLVTHGPYHWVRHPLYSTGLLFFLGLSVLAANWFIALAIMAAFAALTLRTPHEEARLIEKFGDEYRSYMQRTGRYFPRLWWSK
jgi:protein-S-isoprenylcysteine O-methyltransferase Ste14